MTGVVARALCCCRRRPGLPPWSVWYRPSLRSATARSLSVAAAASHTPVMEPSYNDAIHLLNSTQTGYKVLYERLKAGGTLAQADDPVGQMTTWLGYIGYTPQDLDRLNVVHVAGTKGKGTTCALTNSILERYRVRTAAERGGGDATTTPRSGPRKIGLYTSPHLVAVRERIRINSEPLSEAAFARYFFEVWHAFEAGATAQGADPGAKPTYFRFLTLLSLHVFLREGVDAAVYEVGVGGALDATNVFVRPAATAVTTLGIDHVETLGATVDRIAWHKAGIFKPGCAAFTVPQPPAAMDVVVARAAEREAPLVVLAPAVYAPQLAAVRLAPAEDFQRRNAALAVALAATVLRDRLGVDDPALAALADGRAGPLPPAFVDGLESVVWRGRCESMTTGRQRWYLDGAHNAQSLDIACRWFRRAVVDDTAARETATSADDASAPPPAPVNVLIFNQQSVRDAVALLHVVHQTLAAETETETETADDAATPPRWPVHHAVFCTNVTYRDQSWKADFVNNNVDPAALQSLTLQRRLADEWRRLSPETGAVVALPSIEDAVAYVRQIDGGDVDARVLVTGSFHLIGGALTILEEGEDFALANMSSMSRA